MKMQTSAIIHSGVRSGEKHTFGRLYKVVHVHINPKDVSPVDICDHCFKKMLTVRRC
jgi:hypothetical protein